MPLFTRDDRAATGASALVFSLIAVVFAFGALLTAIYADNDDAKAASAAGGTSVSLTEFAITPNSATVPIGGELVVTNSGTATHNLGIDGTDLKTPDLAPGESATLDLSKLEAGMYTMYCEIAGHKGAGMVGDLMVGDSTGHAEHAVNQDRLLAENDASDALMKEPVDAYVKQLTEGANTEGVGNQKLEPNVLLDGTKVFDLTADLVEWQV
ncbi:MAG TPA: cupredoxin domain-containing protein, partial [Acidimicrobiia bacterium]|nr:cupredoxin domain-containing protein [Acidimicrobiia bacterium]